MKIALINENSQAAKNALVYETLKKVVEPMGHEVFNYGMYAADDAAQLTYVQNGILAAILLNSGAADFVVTGCGTGEGAMLALNSFPGVICGHVADPLDAYTFAHINDGNAVSLPFALNFGWGGELKLQYIFEKLFGFGHGQGYPKERVEPPADQGSDILADLRQLVTNWPWVVLLVVGLLFNVYNAVRQGITVIYFTHYMHREVLCSAFLTAIMVASIGGALATGPLARRFGKRVLFVASLLLAGAVNSLFAFCGPGDVAAVFAIGIVGEALSAVFPTLFFTMLGDAADYSEYVNGRRATGLVYSAGSFATKFGGGVAGFIIGIVLARYGYDGKDAEAIAGALPGIRLLMGLIPSAIAAGTAFLMVLYPLSDRRLSEITEELSRRRG